MKQRNLLNVSLLLSVVLGISSTAVFQRVNAFFFMNVFIGSTLSTLIFLLFFKSLRNRWKVDKAVKNYMAAISFLFTFSFLSTIPLTIDRSYSVWLLKNVADASASKAPMTYNQLIKDSENFFKNSNGQLTRRIEEQKRIGNIEIKSRGIVELSRKGLFVVKFNQTVGYFFGLDPKYSRLHE